MRKCLNNLEINEELIVNYSNGHRISSLLLFPYSDFVNFVNNVDKSKVNVILQWSSIVGINYTTVWENKQSKRFLNVNMQV